MNHTSLPSRDHAAALINSVLSSADRLGWGWRLPFLFGIVVGIVGWYLRWRIETYAGIPAEQIEKVFQPFEQVADHLTRQHAGTGLGLPIAKALTELHGGQLLLCSELGVETTVSLRLPSARVRHIAVPAAENNDGHPPLHESEVGRDDNLPGL